MLSSDNAEPINSNHTQKGIEDKNEPIYFIENKQYELERLRKQYEALKSTFGGIFNAPVHKELKEGTVVFDSGCGPGQWVIEMGKEYPQSTFIGFDLSDIFPPRDSRPPNCEFTIHNILNPLPFSESHFGYIHQQFLTCGIAEDQWILVLKEFARTLKPGGWVELTEPALRELVNVGPKVSAVVQRLYDVMERKGVGESTVQTLRSQLTDAGFVNISVTKGLFPMVYREDDSETRKRQFLDGFGSVLQPLLIQSYPELSDPTAFDRFIMEASEECIELNSSTSVYRICGQKPQ